VQPAGWPAVGGRFRPSALQSGAYLAHYRIRIGMQPEVLKML